MRYGAMVCLVIPVRPSGTATPRLSESSGEPWLVGVPAGSSGVTRPVKDPAQLRPTGGLLAVCKKMNA